ncbi:MAG: 3-deoxy-manno-octulosonate cytidylyltransferase [Bilophila sp.]
MEQVKNPSIAGHEACLEPLSPPCYGIIPARYESSRFPGKPLADIWGHPMFWHVYQRAKQCKALRSVTLATDDERIREAAKACGVPCVMTRSDHVSGTDRVYEAACALGVASDAVLVNIQGDEPALDPAMLDALVAPFEEPDVRVATLATAVAADRAASPNQVKVVMAANGDALYFSRAGIPFDRDAVGASFWGHIGVYAFRMEALRAFVNLPPSRLEQLEKLEQLRFLENGIPIRVVCTDKHSHGVDTPKDLEVVRALLASEKKERSFKP